MMIRYSVLPLTLYRLQPAAIPKLREKTDQLSKGQTAYDFTIGPNNLYNPISGDIFMKPNGLSLRPVGLFLAQLLDTIDPKYIFQLPAGLAMPKDMVMINERSDHYSLQTTVPINPRQFEKKAGELLAKQKRITKNDLKKKIIEELKK